MYVLFCITIVNANRTASQYIAYALSERSVKHFKAVYVKSFTREIIHMMHNRPCEPAYQYKTLKL